VTDREYVALVLCHISAEETDQTACRAFCAWADGQYGASECPFLPRVDLLIRLGLPLAPIISGKIHHTEL
jgi:hypothetical protein